MGFLRRFIAMSVVVLSLLLHATSFAGLKVNTLITTPHGQVPIQSLTIGDVITGYNNTDNTIADVIIKKVASEEGTEVVGILTNKGVLEASPEHLFYSITQDGTATIVKAEELEPNSILWSIELEPMLCLGIERYTEPTLFYELSLDEPHLFFSGDAQVVTHNIINCPDILYSSNYVQHYLSYIPIQNENSNPQIIITGTYTPSINPQQPVQKSPAQIEEELTAQLKNAKTDEEIVAAKKAWLDHITKLYAPEMKQCCEDIKMQADPRRKLCSKIQDELDLKAMAAKQKIRLDELQNKINLAKDELKKALDTQKANKDAAAQKIIDDANTAAQKIIDDAAAAKKIIDDAAAQKVIDDAAAKKVIDDALAAAEKTRLANEALAAAAEQTRLANEAIEQKAINDLGTEIQNALDASNKTADPAGALAAIEDLFAPNLLPTQPLGTPPLAPANYANVPLQELNQQVDAALDAWKNNPLAQALKGNPLNAPTQPVQNTQNTNNPANDIAAIQQALKDLGARDPASAQAALNETLNPNAAPSQQAATPPASQATIPLQEFSQPGNSPAHSQSNNAPTQANSTPAKTPAQPAQNTPSEKSPVYDTLAKTATKIVDGLKDDFVDHPVRTAAIIGGTIAVAAVAGPYITPIIAPYAAAAMTPVVAESLLIGAVAVTATYQDEIAEGWEEAQKDPEEAVASLIAGGVKIARDVVIINAATPVVLQGAGAAAKGLSYVLSSKVVAAVANTSEGAVVTVAQAAVTSGEQAAVSSVAKAAGQAEATAVGAQASKTTVAEVTQAAATQGEKATATQAAQAVGKPATAVVLSEAEIAAVAADVEAQVLAEAQVAAEAAAARNQATTQATKAPATQPATQAPATQVQPATKPATPPAAKPATNIPQQAAETATPVVASEEESVVNQIVKKSPTRLNFERQSTPELFRSKRSIEKLIADHKAKIRDYINNPQACDNLGKLQNATEEEMIHEIFGRIINLKSQIKSQSNRLVEIINVLQERGAL